MEFFKIISGSTLWYLEGNVGPWDPDGIFQNNIGVKTLVFGGNVGPCGPRGFTPMDFKENNIGVQTLVFGGKCGPL